MLTPSVVTVAGICNLVGGGVFLTCHRGGGASGNIRWMSRLELLTGNRWPFPLSWNALTAHCTRRPTVDGALSETVATVSLSTVPRLPLLSWQFCRLRVGKRTCGEGGQCHQLAVRSHRDQMTLRK